MATRATPTPEQGRAMAAAYAADRTLQSIAAEFGFSVPTVSKYVRMYNVPIRSKGRRSTRMSDQTVTSTEVTNDNIDMDGNTSDVSSDSDFDF